MKRAFLLICAILGATLLKAEWMNVRGVKWYYELYTDDNGNTVAQINGTEGTGDLTVPATILIEEGSPLVKRIGTQAFLKTKSPNGELITSITIPEGVETIKNNAFSGCTSLKTLTLPSTINWIAPTQFDGCPNLTTVTIGEGSPYSMKDGCMLRTDEMKIEVVAALETATDATGCLTLPVGVTGIASNALQYNKSFTSVVIPNTVTSIKFRAFANTALTSVSIPSSVGTLGERVFESCSNLETAKLPDGLKRIEEGLFYSCSNLTSITIPKNVEFIGGQAFFHSSHLFVTFEGNPPTLQHAYSFSSNSDARGYYLKKNATAWETYFTTYEGGDKELGFLAMEEIDAEVPEKFFVYAHVVGDGVVGGSGWYAPGETVTMKAYVNEDYTLCGWSKDPDEWHTGDTEEGKSFAFTFTMPESGVNVLAYFAPMALIERHVQANTLMTKDAVKDELLKSKEYYTADSLKTFVLGTPKVERVTAEQVAVSVAVIDSAEQNTQGDWIFITRAEDETTAFYKAVVVGDEAEEAPEDVPAETPEDETEEEPQTAA